jgi:hypothetical protein
VDGAQPSAGLGFDLARADGSFEFKGGHCAIGHHCGGHPSGHDHVALGGLLDDDANLGQYGGLQALSSIDSQAWRFNLAGSCMDIDVGHLGHGCFDSHFAAVVGAATGHGAACTDLGWLTYRVMTYDVLAEHASKQERIELMRRYRFPLLGMGVLTGAMGAAPSLVWASGALFAAAFVILIPIAVWIYTLVFVFSALWYVHFLLAALSDMRSEPASFQSDPDTPLRDAIEVESKVLRT